jgi:hypothetical protein
VYHSSFLGVLSSSLGKSQSIDFSCAVTTAGIGTVIRPCMVNFSLKSLQTFAQRAEDRSFAFSPSTEGNFISKCVMPDTLAGDAAHSSSERTRVKLLWGTE